MTRATTEDFAAGEAVFAPYLARKARAAEPPPVEAEAELSAPAAPQDGSDDSDFSLVEEAPAPGRPPEGWIVEVRKRLRMNVRQLANRLGITQQSASRLEANEKDDSITLKSLRRVADAMGCDLVYKLVPREGFEGVLRRQALKKAQESAPAEPGPDREGYISRRADELTLNPTSRLWD